jgi:5'-3' exoribonuclease 2
MTISPWAVHRAVLLLHATSILIIVRAVGAFLPSSAIIGIVPRDYIIPIRGGNTNLQGIKGFRSWFENAFPSAVVTINPDRRDGDGNGSAEFQPETFDHVLIDANQFLHTTLRRAYNRRATRSSDIGRLHLDDDVIEYSLLLFIKEINRITSTTAIPRKSLVIAIDGSPGAAKLDRQRRRRYSIHKKAESQERQIGILRDRGWMDVDFGFSSSSSSSNASANNRGKRNRGSNDPVMRKHDRERVTLNITPGTAFMDMVTNALLYWAWQHVARYPRVRVYISPSSVHGEGEVKLLDWMTFGHRMGGGGGPSSMASSSSSSSPTTVDQRRHRTNVKRNDTVAILGGDSDLVLMGLVVPPSITHNIHVILPGEKGESLVASIWETTRIMAGMIEGTSTYGSRRRNGRANTIRRKRSLTLNQINQVRIDTTLLIILNGNDYLPKVKGCRAGFDSFFPVYLDLVKSWMDGRQGGNDDEDSFLINLDGNGELQMNVRFAMKFFRALASSAETVPSFHDMNKDNSSSSSQSHLGHLNNLVDAKIFPGPITFNTIRPQDSFFRRELWEMNSKLKQNTTRLMSEVFGDDEVEIVRLTIGHIPDDYVPSSDERTSAGSGGEEIFTTFRGGSDGHGVISRMMRSGNTTATGKGRAYLFEVPHRQQR